MRNDSGFKHSGSSGCEENFLDSDCNLQVNPMRFAAGLVQSRSGVRQRIMPIKDIKDNTKVSELRNQQFCLTKERWKKGNLKKGESYGLSFGESIKYLSGDFEWTIQNSSLIFRGCNKIENHQKI